MLPSWHGALNLFAMVQDEIVTWEPEWDNFLEYDREWVPPAVFHNSNGKYQLVFCRISDGGSIQVIMGSEVNCCRSCGWSLWEDPDELFGEKSLGGEGGQLIWRCLRSNFKKTFDMNWYDLLYVLQHRCFMILMCWRWDIMKTHENTWNPPRTCCSKQISWRFWGRPAGLLTRCGGKASLGGRDHSSWWVGGIMMQDES